MARNTSAAHSVEADRHTAAGCRPRPRSCAITILVVFFIGLTLPSIFRFFAEAAYHLRAFSDQGVVKADARDLENTVVVAHQSCELEPGKNVVWCASLQLAWNQLCALAGGSIQAEQQRPLIEHLNAQDIDGEDIDDAACVALAGTLADGIYEKIDAELRRKFKGEEAPQLSRASALGRPEDVFAYAYLFKDLRFATPFEVQAEPLRFGNTDVRCFGFDEDRVTSAEMRGQIRVHEYDEGAGRIVIELLTTERGDQLVLAMVPPQKTLAETVAAVLTQIGGSEGRYVEFWDTLKIPKLNFDITRSYDELAGAPITSTGAVLLAPQQIIRFQLDEEGARLRSESGLPGCAGNPPQPRHLVFDHPFLLIMKLRSADDPYFAIWVDNAELMVKVE